MKLHACRRCGARLRTYADLQEHLLTHPNVCVTCYRVFSRRVDLLAHECKVEEFLCKVCQRSYSTQTKLARHKRETACGHSLPPEAKRQKLTPPVEDLEVPPLVDEYGSELQDVIIQHWGSIRTHASHGSVQSRYNIRLMTLDIGGLELGHIFAAQTTAFKINISYGFILRSRTSNRYRYYHSSCNCCGRYLDEPSLITNTESFQIFLERIKEPDILKWALSQRPNSDWVVELVTNATIFVNRILQHPIGCVGIVLPPHIKRNPSIICLDKDYHSIPYVDNLCLFRCLGLHLGHNPKMLYAKYTDQPVETFEGVTVDELNKVETVFEVNIIVYNRSVISAQLVRRSLGKFANTMYVNLHETHFSLIHDIKGYCQSYKCSKCENSMWRYPSMLERHELRCEVGLRHIYNGGVYHTTPSVFQRLDDEGITVADRLRFYPYRATFDFECFFDGENLPTDSDRVQWIARHVPLSVSVASNVPGHEAAQCYVTNGASDKLVEDMMRGLSAISDAAFDMLISSYDNVLTELEVRKEAWDEAERKAFKEDTSKQEDDEEVEMGEDKINPYKTLIGQLLGWLHQLPVIGFNSGKYDLNVVKQFFVTYLLKPSKQDDDNDVEEEEEDEVRFVIKRQNTFMCFSTRKLRFLDIRNFLAPGYSYDKYLKAYGCELQKGHFPYEYMDGIGKLKDCALPPQEAFYSRLKNEHITDADYARCQVAWRDNRMKTMRDFLVWYNNRDVVPFLDAIDKQFAFYKQQNIDMFKDGISVPGLTLLYLFNELPSNTFFTVFNQTNSDLHLLVKDNIVGGPAIIFHRYHEKDITKIRGEETCRAIVGYDANALYLWALMQDMPTGWYVRRREENQFRPQKAQPFGQMAVQWLTWESAKSGCAIRHQVNGREKRIGKRRVDGWCAETRTAYQFHGCFWHGCPKCYDQNETNSVNGKTMAVLLEDTKKNTSYLRRHVKVVEMWECEWKEVRNESDVKTFLPPSSRPRWFMTQHQILAAVVDGTLFGMVECDVRVPEELQDYFSEMQPVFKNASITRDDIGPFMRQYAEEHDILSKPRVMLVGSFRGVKILLATPLLRWYLAHGLVVDRVYQIIEYEPNPCFRRFGESVSAARRAGDEDPDKAIIADTMKLLGNSGYGKTVTNVDRHRDVKYCTEIGTSALINNKRFRQLEVVTKDAYEIEMNKSVVKYTLPLHIGFFVYQYAKLRMLQFYYDFVDRYVERPLFQYCEMDTDSAYIALAGESIDGLVKADRRAHYFRHRSQWLPAECCDEHEDDYVRARIAGCPWTATESCCFARKAFDKRTPGLFKVEWCGDGFVGLCSKTYYCFGTTDKYSTKGLSKRHNDIDKDTFLAVLTNRRSGGGVNRGFRVRNSSVMTYIQERAALTYFYGKRKVLADGLSTAPLEV